MVGERIAPHDLFGVNEALAENTGRDTYRVGEAAFSRTVAELEEHQDLFVDGGVEALAERRRLAAQDRFRTEKEMGKHNDFTVDDSGFVALLSTDVTPSRKRILRDIFEVEQPQLDFPTLVEVEHPSGDDSRHLIGLTFLAGYVSLEHKRGSIDEIIDIAVWQPTEQFYSQVREHTHSSSDGRLYLQRSEVARIETNSGRLWQNPQFTPTGAPVGWEPGLY